MNLIEKLRIEIPLIESNIPIEYEFNGFKVIELLDVGLYSLMVIYNGNILCNRATFRNTGCKRYKNKAKNEVYPNGEKLDKFIEGVYEMKACK